MANLVLSLSVLHGRLAVCRLDARESIPEWAVGGKFFSISHTSEELSIICDEKQVPAGVHCNRDWRVLKLEGPFDFNQVGILASVIEPLAAAAIPILAVGTFDTDYILVKEGHLERAVTVMLAAGHAVHRDPEHGTT